MANPYHDAEGKFCSRNGMLDSINSLAVAGKVTEYIQLKSEFDVIDKDTVVIDKAELEALMARANGTESSDKEAGGLIENLDSETLASMVEDLNASADQGKFGDFRGEILAIVEASNYHDSVIYSAMKGNVLSYETKISLLEVNPSGFGELAKSDPARVFSNNKAEFISYLKGISRSDDANNYSNMILHEGVGLLADNASGLEDLKLANKLLPYGEFAGHGAEHIAASPYIDKTLAFTVLRNELNAASENYVNTRSALAKNLKARGIVVPDRQLYESGSLLPMFGKPEPELLVANLDALKAKGRLRVSEEERVERLQSKFDAYVGNYEQLKADLKKAKKGGVAQATESYELKKRLWKTEMHLNDVTDYNVLAKEIGELNF